LADRLRVAGYQMAVTGDVACNRDAILAAIGRAAGEGADVLLTPEGSLSGYTPSFDRDEVAEALGVVKDRAREAGLALALGTCYEEDDGVCYNQIRFYDSAGEFLGFHSKILRCGSLTDPPTGEINDYGVTPLRTFELKGITVGGLICNDAWANPECTPMDDPYLTRQLAEMGARVVFNAVNGGRSGNEYSLKVVWPFHQSNLRMRAKASRLWIVTTDNAHPTDIPCACPGGVIRPDGNYLVEAESTGEQFFVADLTFDS
jgi:predicted amidohydrolase